MDTSLTIRKLAYDYVGHFCVPIIYENFKTNKFRVLGRDKRIVETIDSENSYDIPYKDNCDFNRGRDYCGLGEFIDVRA